MSLSNRFIEIRKHYGLSQSEFAKMINRTQGFVSNIETERCDISKNTIHTICSLFDINETWLVTGKGDMLAKGKLISKADKESASLRIRQICLQEGLTQQEFADIIGYSKRQVYSVEAKKVTPSNDFLRKIAICFNVSYDWLLTGVGEIELKEAIVDEKLIEWLKKNPDIVKELRIRSGLD